MRYLIDTQIIVWAKEDNRNLSASVKSILMDSNNQILISQISIFELAIKLKLGKLPNFTIGLSDFTNKLWDDEFTLLPIKNAHLFEYNTIPLFNDHRDPFDRLLIATARFENVSIISADEKFAYYSDLVNIISI